MKFLKSFTSFLLALSIILSIGGISVHKHYCGDFLASFSLYAPADDCSDGKEEESCKKMEKDCCEDETEYFAADLDVIKQEIKDFQLVPDFFLVDIKQEEKSEFVPLDLCAEAMPPPINSPPVYILNTQLTYYG